MNSKQGETRPLLLGHRGARRYAPENTIAAFDLALQHGCDGFEFDVRRTLDGRAAICHDPRLNRQEIACTPHAALLARSNALCTLEEVLERYAARAYLYIELKVPGLEREVLSAIAARPPQRGHVLASFDVEVLCALRALDAAIPLGFICDERKSFARWCELPVQVVMPQYELVSPTIVDEIHAAGRQVFVWTVNRQRDMLALAGLGVDAILSDDTELLCRTIDRQKRTPHS